MSNEELFAGIINEEEASRNNPKIKDSLIKKIIGVLYNNDYDNGLELISRYERQARAILSLLSEAMPTQEELAVFFYTYRGLDLMGNKSLEHLDSMNSNILAKAIHSEIQGRLGL